VVDLTHFKEPPPDKMHRRGGWKPEELLEQDRLSTSTWGLSKLMEVRHEPPGNRKEDVGSDELGRRVNDLRMIQTQGLPCTATLYSMLPRGPALTSSRKEQTFAETWEALRLPTSSDDARRRWEKYEAQNTSAWPCALPPRQHITDEQRVVLRTREGGWRASNEMDGGAPHKMRFLSTAPLTSVSTSLGPSRPSPSPPSGLNTRFKRSFDKTDSLDMLTDIASFAGAAPQYRPSTYRPIGVGSTTWMGRSEADGTLVPITDRRLSLDRPFTVRPPRRGEMAPQNWLRKGVGTGGGNRYLNKPKDSTDRSEGLSLRAAALKDLLEEQLVQPPRSPRRMLRRLPKRSPHSEVSPATSPAKIPASPRSISLAPPAIVLDVSAPGSPRHNFVQHPSPHMSQMTAAEAIRPPSPKPMPQVRRKNKPAKKDTVPEKAPAISEAEKEAARQLREREEWPWLKQKHEGEHYLWAIRNYAGSLV